MLVKLEKAACSKSVLIKKLTYYFCKPKSHVHIQIKELLNSISNVRLTLQTSYFLHGISNTKIGYCEFFFTKNFHKKLTIKYLKSKNVNNNFFILFIFFKKDFEIQDFLKKQCP